MAATAPDEHLAVAPTCHAYSGEDVSMGEADRLNWICDNDSWQDGAAVSWLRFTDWDRRDPPRVFASRITKFTSIAIAARDGDGTMRTFEYRMAEAKPIVAGGVFTLALPPQRADTEAYLVRILRPHSVTIASDARLSRNPQEVAGTISAVLILVLVLGMLFTPLLFDINFYFILRERFVLLHAAMILAMMAFILFSGGLITFFHPVPIGVMALLGPLCWPVGAGLAGFFMNAYLEAEALPPIYRRIVKLTAWWVILVPGFCALKFDFAQPFGNQLYFLAFLPIVPVYAGAIIIALWRRSRAARFLAVAWLPVIAAGTERYFRGIGLYSGNDAIDDLLVLALGLEVIIIALGVADRFVGIRRERDQALGEAKTLSEISERDVLTGLLNRRALHDRFESLRREGFVNLALFDLDRFKDINDRFGHHTGDKVLRAAAVALVGDSDSRVFRIGGEEFLVLFRGGNIRERAENARRAIAPRVSGHVPGLDRIVTASVGMVEMPFDSISKSGFAELYEHADRLLYAAKAGGRNRLVSEKVQVFRQRKESAEASAA
ncbi:diguanylate cyclase (GGDEF)-like protein [Altererythrobacter atlanticus]|uniref:diguanylate cyclase n=1 Tax=Croceibacterium atlanticum TaxID=1267766 RepID=A0A0F7KWE4_9SPHN|nr:diguanylate cyclase [Croceibacterium atlanticum]AKH43105.1 Diguanylate cyclase YdeH [Croceibacterium atlanticum]MBB5732191.1 diguanylate cyclase (GGDEF)-like protein [Croceibacterium atlanticum]